MNAKLCKAVRRVARASGLPAEDQHLINKRTGVIRVGKCQRGLVRNLKRRIKRGELKTISQVTLAKETHAARVGS